MKFDVSSQNLRKKKNNLGVLGLDLHSSSPEPVNFFGAQSSLGGTQFSFGGEQAVILGGHGPGMPPVAPGLVPDQDRKR